MKTKEGQFYDLRKAISVLQESLSSENETLFIVRDIGASGNKLSVSDTWVRGIDQEIKQEISSIVQTFLKERTAELVNNVCDRLKKKAADMGECIIIEKEKELSNAKDELDQLCKVEVLL